MELSLTVNGKKNECKSPISFNEKTFRINESKLQYGIKLSGQLNLIYSRYSFTENAEVEFWYLGNVLSVKITETN